MSKKLKDYFQDEIKRIKAKIDGHPQPAYLERYLPLIVQYLDAIIKLDQLKLDP